MCGIYGSTIIYNNEQVKSKLTRTSFRGPDYMEWKHIRASEEKTVIFGHNRLSIIDLDSRSNQPFIYLEKIHIVYNGEIYNFKKIKKTLAQKGYVFNTTSDTEVICAAYLEYGKNCVDYFTGMFAFVIYDEQKQLMFGARDRLGKKPFYYYHNGKDFEFASQISSIQLFNDRLSISKNSISYYLAWGNIPDPHSIFNEIHKLLPGHYFFFNIQNGVFENESYWDIDYLGDNSYKGTYQQATEELENLLTDAVSSRLFADVPVGVFLSGGVDSSLITALATKSTTEKVKTFSVKFNEKGFDESPYAQQVANHLNTDHHVIECNYSDGLDLIENFCHYYDEPFSDSSAIPSMLLAKYTKQHVTVALSGDGGDESFIGYHRYNWVNYINHIYSLPKPIRHLGVKVLNILPYYKFKTIASVISNEDVNNAYVSMMANADSSLFSNDVNVLDVIEKKYLFHNNKNIYERVSDFDIKTYLNWDINTKVDRATMANSLEARAPLMDHRIVEFARSLPTNYKYVKGNQKRILKDVLYKHVPKTIFDRPKSGFTMPFKEWFKNDLKDMVLSELGKEGLQWIPGINIEKTQKIINEHMSGKSNNYPIIWSLLVLKQWLKNNKGYTIK